MLALHLISLSIVPLVWSENVEHAGMMPMLLANSINVSAGVVHPVHIGDFRATAASTTTRYLVFRDGGRGQGLGNILKGFIAAAIWSQQTDRFLCVDWRAFHEAFQVRNPCPQNITKHPAAHVHFWNFGKSDNFLKIQDILESPAPVVIYDGNSHFQLDIPDSDLSKRLQEEYLTPTDALQSLLPWNRDNHEYMPNDAIAKFSKEFDCAVHLRKPDPRGDHRDGLDDATLSVLGSHLSNRTCYFLTNHVPWYEEMAIKNGWKHPRWQTVRHMTAQSNNLEMWADWCTLYLISTLPGSIILHTPSGFSQSAAFAAGTRQSFDIRGINKTTGSLHLEFDNDIELP